MPKKVATEIERAIDPWLQHMRWRRDFAHWRERRINQERYQDERLDMVAAAAGPLVDMRLLDLGAGMGGFAVAATLRGARVIASEYSPAYCTIVRLRAARHGMKLPVFNAAGEALPFANATFDTVVAWDVIEHVQSPVAMLAEIARVLRPGGHCLITAINRRAWVDPHYHLRGINWLPRPMAERIIARRGRGKGGAAFHDLQRLSDMHYFHYGQFVRLCKRQGFVVKDIRQEQLRRGELLSPKISRRALRNALRTLGVEGLAYRIQRRWYVGMFELDLEKK
jgi:SAM-dependent methyltransferase